MKFIVENNTLEKHQNSCIIAGIFELRRLSQAAEKIDKISKGYISNLLRRNEIEGKIGQKVLLYHVPNIISKHILLIGCGKEHELDDLKYRLIIKKAVNVISNTNSSEVSCFLVELDVKERNTYWKVRQAVEVFKETLYEFNQLKTDKIESHSLLKKIVFSIPDSRDLTISEYAISHGLAIASGIKAARDLGNLPPNICNAAYLASQATELANTFNESISINIVNEQKMQELGMRSYLSVGNGSKNESIMSIIYYKGDQKNQKNPIVLIGKGLTFDSGGISIKSAENMNEMKYDMCGAASVYGIMKTVAELQLPLNIIGILAGCENMLSSCSYRPGDILTTMSGKTVEIINTDAEGRLVLCDVLTYVERFNPEVVIDIATLTGACVIALGYNISGLMSNRNSLAQELITASEQSGDLAWNLPLDNSFQKQLKSKFADIANIGGRPGSVITAGYFLSKFTNKYNWAHLDIAGTAYYPSNEGGGATGRPVAMLSQFLLNRSGLNYI